jgi:hypothetical protein
MGRPPIGEQAMSAAERQRRHRAKFRDSPPVTKPSVFANMQHQNSRGETMKTKQPKGKHVAFGAVARRRALTGVGTAPNYNSARLLDGPRFSQHPSRGWATAPPTHLCLSAVHQ